MPGVLGSLHTVYPTAQWGGRGRDMWLLLSHSFDSFFPYVRGLNG